jgi:hypothetical protein
MARLDYRIPQFQLTIGDFDLTDYLDLLELTQGISEQANPLIWTGQLEVSFNQRAMQRGLTPADFDPLAMPQRWRPVQAPLRLTLLGYPFPTLRLRKYVFNPQTRTGRGEIFQLLGAVGDRPGEEVETTVGRMGTPLFTVALKLLETAFAPATITPEIDLLPLTGSLDAPIATRNGVADAQRIVFTNYHWLWCDHQERICSISGDPQQQPIVLVRSQQQVELEPDLEGIDFAAEQAIYTASRQVAKPPPPIEKPDKPEESHDAEGKPRRLVTESWKYRYEVFPELYGSKAGKLKFDTAKVLAEEKVIRHLYWENGAVFEAIPQPEAAPGQNPPPPPPQVTDFAAQYQVGDRAQTVTEFRRPRGAIPGFQKKFPGDTGMVLAEKLIETEFCRCRLITRGEKFPKQFAFDTTLTVDELEMLTIGRVEPDGTIPSQADPRTGGKRKLEDLPRKEYRLSAPEVDLEDQTLRSEVTLQPAGWTPIVPQTHTEDLGFMPDQAHLDAVAQQLALREVRRRDAINVQMPVPIEWLRSGCKPLQRCRLHTYELQIDNPILRLADGECIFAFTGGLIGTIAPIPAPPDPLPWVPLALPNQLQIVPSPGAVLLVNTPIALPPLSAIGGTPPYTWSAITSLPAGLTLSAGGVWAGTPIAATAAALYTVQVQDSASATATLAVSLTVLALEVPVPVVLVQSQVAIGITVQMELVSFAPLLPLTVGAIATVDLYAPTAIATRRTNLIEIAEMRIEHPPNPTEVEAML